MARTVTAFFDGEVLRPIEPLDLEQDREYTVTIAELESTDPYADRPLMRYADISIDTGLGDFAEQHDHYLYGTPKR
jgi:hypothetical protein